MNAPVTLRGVGLAWRPELADLCARRLTVTPATFTEVVAEYVYWRGSVPAELRLLVERGVPVIPHGISLSLGGAERVDMRHVDRLARLAEALEAPLVSEHIAYVRAKGVEVGHLTPIPRTHEMLEVLIENVRQAQAALPVPIALENIATLFTWPEDELDDAELLGTLVAETGCQLLLDISNVQANALNHSFDAKAQLDALPLDKVAYAHVGGGTERDGLYHDTHKHALREDSLELVRYLAERGHHIAVLLERDDDFPPDEALEAELDAIRAAQTVGSRAAAADG
ncbi:MAG: DUF692 domain-containing protein [Myxococcales bacterium]|nr:DUF692 domain-containing protein [Myxococcales bacterium]